MLSDSGVVPGRRHNLSLNLSPAVCLPRFHAISTVITTVDAVVGAVVTGVGVDVAAAVPTVVMIAAFAFPCW